MTRTKPKPFWYSTTPALGWCFAHYFFGGTHYSWFASPFFTYRLPNPASSNPLLVYEALYMPWKERDAYSKTIAQYRLSVRNGVIAAGPRLAFPVAQRLRVVTERVDVDLFMPLVYRVDIDTLAAERLRVAGSGLAGSREYLIPDLQETEFDLLFTDELIGDLADLLSGTLNADDALRILEGRCEPSA